MSTALVKWLKFGELLILVLWRIWYSFFMKEQT